MEERFGPDALTIGAFRQFRSAFSSLSILTHRADLNGVGVLKVDLAPSTVRVMLDGLGRVTGALDLVDEGRDDILQNVVIPTIFLHRSLDNARCCIRKWANFFP